jgi:hypothetical protein
MIREKCRDVRKWKNKQYYDWHFSLMSVQLGEAVMGVM